MLQIIFSTPGISEKYLALTLYSLYLFRPVISNDVAPRSEISVLFGRKK